MEKKTLRISSSGLKNIVFTDNDNFKFIFGAKEIEMNRILADFISPRVSNLHHSDPTISSYNFGDIFHCILSDSNSMKIFRQIQSKSLKSDQPNEEEEEEYNDANNDQSTFEANDQLQSQFSENIINDEIIDLLIQISRGDEVDIDAEMCIKLRILSIILGNEEIFQLLNDLFPHNINKTNLNLFLLYLQNIKNYQFFPFINEKQAIDYIAKHFYLIDEDDLIKLPKSILYMIISNERLVLDSEDSLFTFINDLFDDEEEENETEDFNITSFYELIEFSELSEKKFNKFMKNFDPNNISYSLWRKLSKCFYFPMRSSLKIKEEDSSRSSSKRYFSLTRKILYSYNGNAQNRFKGIIHHLHERYGGNVHDKGVVQVTSSSVYFPSCSPKNAADLESNIYFASNNEENSWICYDFKDRKVRPTHYSLRSRRDCGKDGNHLKKWVIEASNDQKNWKMLDTRKKEKSLNDANASNTFNIQFELNDDEYFRYLRLRQIGRNTGTNYHLNISALEFFGSVIEKISQNSI